MIFWIVQGLGCITTTIAIISFFQKEKWQIMLYMTVANALIAITYLIGDNVLGCIMVVGAVLRTSVYYYYSKKGKKPNIAVLISFELYCAVFAIIMWSGPASIFIVTNMAMLAYTTWQDDLLVLRISYIISSCLLITYDILVGAYTTALSEMVMIIGVSLSIIKYSKHKSSQKECESDISVVQELQENQINAQTIK